MNPNIFAVAAVFLVAIGYVLDERYQWTDPVAAFCNKRDKGVAIAGWVFIVLCFVKIGYFNGPYTLFSNDCPLGMDYQAVKEQLNLTTEEYNKLAPVIWPK